jgi:hypothetical protein
VKTITITCDNCGKKVEKKKGEIDRQRRRGRNTFYCSRSCAGSASCEHLKKYEPWPVWEHYKRKPDEYTPFRKFVRSAKKREIEHKTRELVVDITCQYLKDLWENQNGKCAITNIEMTLNKDHSPFQASLDRIDNDKGYIKGNVRFICLITNYARNTWNDDIVKEFITKATL